jgi:hypothetical protein
VKKIISLTTIDEEGKTETWVGHGTLRIVKTRTPLEKTLPVYWPETTYITAHLDPE